jgi:hypothetical protein
MSRIKFLPVQLAGSTLIYLMNRVQPANTRLIVPQKRQERATVGMEGSRRFSCAQRRFGKNLPLLISGPSHKKT